MQSGGHIQAQVAADEDRGALTAVVAASLHCWANSFESYASLYCSSTYQRQNNDWDVFMQPRLV
jgi:hypothetical protein